MRTEAAVCVALHPEGIRPSILGAMLWPLGATADVVGATVERLRSWLGQDSQGAPHLREDAEGRLVLGPGVVLDWDVLRSLLDSSRRCAPQQEVELLTEALRLVRGPMVSDAAEGHYTWLARVRAARQFDALVVRRGRGELEQEIRILLDAAGADDLDQIDPATAALVEDLSPGLSVGRRPA